MKQFTFSMLLSFMLCVLIGYFEPANATKASRSFTTKSIGTSNSFVALNSTTDACPFWPNPIAPNSILTAIAPSSEIIVGGMLQSVVETNQYFVPDVIAYNQDVPLSVVETNQYFVPNVIKTLTGTTLSIPSLPDGNYILTLTTKSGNVYFTKISVSSK